MVINVVLECGTLGIIPEDGSLYVMAVEFLLLELLQQAVASLAAIGRRDWLCAFGIHAPPVLDVEDNNCSASKGCQRSAASNRPCPKATERKCQQMAQVAEVLCTHMSSYMSGIAGHKACI